MIDKKQALRNQFAINGAPFITQVGAPNPYLYIKAPDDLAAEIFTRKTTARENGIADLMSKMANPDRMTAAIRWDCDLSPRTTNKKQLTELGVTVPESLETLEDNQIHATLWRIIYNLARMGIFLSETNTYTDRDLLNFLITRVLLDEIPDLPPTPDLSEFISAHTSERVGLDEVVERDQLLPRPDRSHLTLDDFLNTKIVPSKS